MCSGGKKASVQELEPAKAYNANLGAQGDQVTAEDQIRRGISSAFHRKAMNATQAGGGLSTKLGG